MIIKKDYESPIIGFRGLFCEKVLTASEPIFDNGGFYIDGYDFEGKWWD